MVVENNIEEMKTEKREYNLLSSINKCSYLVNVNTCFFLKDDDDNHLKSILSLICNTTISL